MIIIGNLKPKIKIRVNGKSYKLNWLEETKIELEQ